MEMISDEEMAVSQGGSSGLPLDGMSELTLQGFSRVGGAAQVKTMKQVAGTLKLELAQYRDGQLLRSHGLIGMLLCTSCSVEVS